MYLCVRIVWRRKTSRSTLNSWAGQGFVSVDGRWGPRGGWGLSRGYSRMVNCVSVFCWEGKGVSVHLGPCVQLCAVDAVGVAGC